MAASKAVPADGTLESANDHLKSTFRVSFWGSMILATLIHFSVFALWPELTAEDFSFVGEELTAIEIPPEVTIPPAPQQIARPAVPVIATADIDEDITIATTTFEDNPVDELPLPPAAEANVDLAAAPTFTPFTVAPDILNRDEILKAMVQSYPSLLREAGIGGTVRVYFFIDEVGEVLQTRIDQSSGHQMLDEAALAVANMYRFSPALNRDQKVKVWVSFPIIFQVR